MRRDLRAGFCVTGNTYYSLSGVVHQCAPFDGWAEKACQATPFGKMAIQVCFMSVGHGYLQYKGSGWRGSHSPLHHAFHIYLTYARKVAVLFSDDTSLAVVKNNAMGSGKKGAKKNAGGTSGGNVDDKSNKQRSKNNFYTAKNTNCAEAPGWKSTAPSIKLD